MRRSEQIAEQVGEFGGHTIRPIAFGGHCLYCIKSVTGEQVGENFFDRALDGIALPQKFANLQNQLKVLAKGPNVGKPCSKFHQRKFKRARWLDDQVQIGDIILCPEQDPGIRMSALWPEIEFFIEESVPQVIIPKELVQNVRSST